MGDTTTRDALERSICARLPLCDEAELRAIARVLVSVEKRRNHADLIERMRQRQPEIAAA
jgi:hypothetical protein